MREAICWTSLGNKGFATCDRAILKKRPDTAGSHLFAAACANLVMVYHRYLYCRSLIQWDEMAFSVPVYGSRFMADSGVWRMANMHPDFHLWCRSICPR